MARAEVYFKKKKITFFVKKCVCFLPLASGWMFGSLLLCLVLVFFFMSFLICLPVNCFGFWGTISGRPLFPSWAGSSDVEPSGTQQTRRWKLGIHYSRRIMRKSGSMCFFSLPSSLFSQARSTAKILTLSTMNEAFVAIPIFWEPGRHSRHCIATTNSSSASAYYPEKLISCQD